MKAFMIDWHSHILPGVDDGAADIEQSLLMASALEKAGFLTVYCTPHLMRGCYETSSEQVRRGVVELQERLEERGSLLKLLPGREYCLDEYLPELLEDPITLGDSRQILVEILPQTTPDMVRQLIYRVVRSGFTPVIAHPERCHLLEPVGRRLESRGLFNDLKSWFSFSSGNRMATVQDDSTGNHLLDYLRDVGCSFQGNLGSFCGYYGERPRVVAEAMKQLGIFDRFGSDLHNPAQSSQILAVRLV